jgi:hypothetical protein
LIRQGQTANAAARAKAEILELGYRRDPEPRQLLASEPFHMNAAATPVDDLRPLDGMSVGVTVK